MFPINLSLTIDGTIATKVQNTRQNLNIKHKVSLQPQQFIDLMTSISDIVEGNIKSIMRLILAVAAHFKPNSVKQAPSSGAASPVAKASPRANTSITGIAQVREI